MAIGEDISEHARPAIWTRDFVLICLANFAIFAAFQLQMPVLPEYARHLGGGQELMGLITGVFTVSALLVRPYLGMQMDLRGRRGIFLFGLIVFFLATVAYNWMGTLSLLLIMRLVHGGGWGGVTTASGTIVADLIPPQRRGEGLGYYGMFANLAMAVGPATGVYIIRYYNFTLAFFISALLTAMAVAVAFLVRVPNAPFHDSKGDQRPALFEVSSLQPGLVMIFVTVTWGGVVTFLADYGITKGIENVGLFFTVYAAVLMLIRPLAGMASDRNGPAIVVIPGMIFVSASMVLLALAQSLPSFLLAAVFYGLGFGAVGPTMQAVIITRAAPTRRGAANATFFSAFDLGIGLGFVMLGLVAGRWGYEAMYLLASVSGLIGLVTFGVQERQRKAGSGETN